MQFMHAAAWCMGKQGYSNCCTQSLGQSQHARYKQLRAIYSGSACVCSQAAQARAVYIRS